MELHQQYTGVGPFIWFKTILDQSLLLEEEKKKTGDETNVALAYL